jgi:hypothetical protein
LWLRRFPDSGNEEATSIAVSPGAVYVSGTGTTRGSQVLLRTIAYSSSGTVLWKQTRGGGATLLMAVTVTRRLIQ